MLQTNDEIDLFLALNDPMAEGAYIAAKNAGREGDILLLDLMDFLHQMVVFEALWMEDSA